MWIFSWGYDEQAAMKQAGSSINASDLYWESSIKFQLEHLHIFTAGFYNFLRTARKIYDSKSIRS
jgi:hypothetical protein